MFREVDGEPRRVVLDPDVAVDVETVSTDEDHLTEDLTAFAQRPFDLTAELPVRFGHFVGAASGDVVCFVVQHIVFDAVSGAVLAGELLELYRSFAESEDVPERLREQVARHVEAPPSERSLRYWRTQLDAARSRRLNLAPPARPAESPFAGARIVTHLSPAAVRGVRGLCETLGVTENIVLLAAYNLLLARHGLGDDIVVGLPLDTRGKRHRSVVGLHINTVALRTPVDPRSTFQELARATRDVLLQAMLNSDASVDDVSPGSYDSTDDWWIALFRHMFNYRPSEMRNADDRATRSSSGVHRPHPADLELVVTPRDNGITLKAVYATGVHGRRSGRRAAPPLRRPAPAGRAGPHRPSPSCRRNREKVQRQPGERHAREDQCADREEQRLGRRPTRPASRSAGRAARNTGRLRPTTGTDHQNRQRGAEGQHERRIGDRQRLDRHDARRRDHASVLIGGLR